MTPWKETSAKDFAPSGPQERTTMDKVFPPPAQPQSEAAVYRLLAPTASIRVSPLCLGAMSLGDQWTGFMGGKGLNEEEAFAYLDAFYEAGGNFVDTANAYQDEQSEMILGDWMSARANRDNMVIATKFTTGYTVRAGQNAPGINVNYAGNGKKSLRLSLEASLRKLRTDYIDLLYVHWWDYTTSIPELMRELDDVVRSGKVLYLGISDTPAWIVAGANEYARAHGLSQFVVYQGRWNLALRDFERDILPMARHYGMAAVPWGALGQGKFKTPAEIKARASLRNNSQPTPDEIKCSQVLESIAAEVGNGATLVSVALAWIRQKYAYCFPLIGGTSIAHLQENIRALKVHLTDDQMQTLDKAVDYDPGFPLNFIGADPHGQPGGEQRQNGLFSYPGKVVFAQ